MNTEGWGEENGVWDMKIWPGSTKGSESGGNPLTLPHTPRPRLRVSTVAWGRGFQLSASLWSGRTHGFQSQHLVIAMSMQEGRRETASHGIQLGGGNRSREGGWGRDKLAPLTPGWAEEAGVDVPP